MLREFDATIVRIDTEKELASNDNNVITVTFSQCSVQELPKLVHFTVNECPEVIILIASENEDRWKDIATHVLPLN